MKIFTREQFEEMATAIMKNICAEVDLSDRQFDLVVDVVAKTMTQSLIEQGYSLPWVKRRRN